MSKVLSTYILEGIVDKAEDEEEDTGDFVESRPLATGRWKEMSTYGIYMVYMPNASNYGYGPYDDRSTS